MGKTKGQTVIEQSRDDLNGVLERLRELQSTDPYLTDAVAFVTQGVVMLEKHLLAEFDVKPPAPKPEQPDVPDKPGTTKSKAAKAKPKPTQLPA
jgi:hypothetical protein